MTKEIIEIDIPKVAIRNSGGGMWEIVLTPKVEFVTDDKGRTGYYSYKNNKTYNVLAIIVDGVPQEKTNTREECFFTDSSFFYTEESTKLIMHFVNHEPPIGKKIVAHCTEV